MLITPDVNNHLLALILINMLIDLWINFKRKDLFKHSVKINHKTIRKILDK